MRPPYGGWDEVGMWFLQEFVMPYKCSVCYLILQDESVEDDTCPYCNSKVTKMCPEDHVCTCHEDVQSGLHVCQNCGEFTCACGSHDVELTSRITGYLSALSGWNRGKSQEFKDRTRYNALTGAMYSSVDGTPKEYK